MMRFSMSRIQIAVILILFFQTVVHCLLCCGHYSHQTSLRRFESSSSSLSLLSSSSSSFTSHKDTTITQRLLGYLDRNDTETFVTVEGYVVSKRSFGKKLVFVDLEIPSDPPDLCQALLKQECFSNQQQQQQQQQQQYYEGYRRSFLKGTLLRVTGTAAPTQNPGNVVLLVHSIQLLQLPRQLQHIQTILQQCRKGRLALTEVANASHLSQSDLQQRWMDLNSDDPLLLERLQQLSKDIYSLLSLPPNQNQQQQQQQEDSRKGTFVLPKAPEQWRQVPVEQRITNSKEVISGWIQNRQRFQENITVVTLMIHHQNNNNLSDPSRLSCLVHPDLLQQDAGLYRNLMAVGAQMEMQGYYYLQNKQEPIIFWVQHMRLLQSSDRPETIRYLLELMATNQMDMEEAAQALQLSYHEAVSMARSLDATERQWKANQLAAQLQKVSPSQQQRHNLDPELLRPLEKYRPVAQKYPVQLVGRLNENPNTASMFLRTGVAGSRWMSQKKPQLEWMCQQIRSVLESHPDYEQRKLTILDIGGGQGFLANGLGQAMMDHVEQIHVVDICARAVHNGAARAQRLGTPVAFEIADASSSALETVKADVVVALHACGHLSDVALAHAVHRQAGFVIVPCCFNSNPHLRIPSSGETVDEWLGIPSSDWSALKRIAEVQGDIALATKAMEMICAVRADAAQEKWKNDGNMKVQIRQFPMEYSTRNTVLVGSFV